MSFQEEIEDSEQRKVNKLQGIIDNEQINTKIISIFYRNTFSIMSCIF